MQNRCLSVLAAACLIVTAAPVTANIGPYAGASIGIATIEDDHRIDLDGERRRLSFDGDDTAFKFYGGWMFNTFFGLEAGYVNFGSPSDGVRFAADPGTLRGKAEVELWGWTAALVGSLDLGVVDVFGKVGMLAWDGRVKFRGTFDDGSGAVSTGFSDRSNGEDLMYGIGGSYRIGNLRIRLEYEKFDVSGTDDVDLVSVGLTFHLRH
jgi:hypothetical protein